MTKYIILKRFAEFALYASFFVAANSALAYSANNEILAKESVVAKPLTVVASQDRVSADDSEEADEADTDMKFYLQEGKEAYGRKDFKKALSSFEIATEIGSPEATFWLGWLYDRGEGVAQNYQTAFKWYRKAADQGFADAELNLGVLYAEGQGTPKNYLEAANWFRKAADQGVATAQYNLGLMYGDGSGVAQDTAKAAHWYKLAAAQGNEEAAVELESLNASTQGHDAFDHAGSTPGISNPSSGMEMSDAVGRQIPGDKTAEPASPDSSLSDGDPESVGDTSVRDTIVGFLVVLFLLWLIFSLAKRRRKMKSEEDIVLVECSHCGEKHPLNAQGTCPVCGAARDATMRESELLKKENEIGASEFADRPASKRRLEGWEWAKRHPLGAVLLVFFGSIFGVGFGMFNDGYFDAILGSSVMPISDSKVQAANMPPEVDSVLSIMTWAFSFAGFTIFGIFILYYLSTRRGRIKIWPISVAVGLLAFWIYTFGTPAFYGSCQSYILSGLKDPDSFKYIGSKSHTYTDDNGTHEEIVIEYSATNSFNARLSDSLQCSWTKPKGSHSWFPDWTFDQRYAMPEGIFD